MFLIIVILILLAVYFRYRQMSILKRNGIDGPAPNLIYGNLFTHFDGKNVERFQKYFDKYGKICGYYIGKQPNVIVNDIELIKQIQIKDFAKFSDRPHPSIKHGIHPSPKFFHNIINSQSSHWKETRSILNPTFSAMKLKMMTSTISSSIDIFLDKVNKHANKKEEFDIYSYLQLLTTDVIAKCGLGIDTDVQHNPNDPFLKAAKKLFDVYPSKILMMLTCFPELDIILYPFRRLLQTINEQIGNSNTYTISKLIKKAIELRKNISNKKNDLLQLMLDTNINENDIKNKSMDNLSMELDSQNEVINENRATSMSNKNVKSLSQDEVIANAIIFYEAGFETTSTMLGFVFHILVNHPDIQEKVRQEVNELFNEEQKFDYNTVSKLSYLQCVINETMRFYPPVTSFVSRQCSEDYKYKNITIPKGSRITIPTYPLHHNEEYWPNHDVFDPERFKDKKNIDSIAFQPFGAGPRNCIGMRFALYEAKLLLAKLLHKYRLVPGPSTEIGDIAIDFKIITETPRNGVYVKAVSLD